MRGRNAEFEQPQPITCGGAADVELVHEYVIARDDVAGATYSDPRTRSPGRDPERLSDLFWIEELDPRADRVLTSREPFAADLFFASLVVLTIDTYRMLVSAVDPTIVILRDAATKALADDFGVDLSNRPRPEPDVAIACAREAADAWTRWVHRV